MIPHLPVDDLEVLGGEPLHGHKAELVGNVVVPNPVDHTHYSHICKLYSGLRTFIIVSSPQLKIMQSQLSLSLSLSRTHMIAEFEGKLTGPNTRKQTE